MKTLIAAAALFASACALEPATPAEVGATGEALSSSINYTIVNTQHYVQSDVSSTTASPAFANTTFSDQRLSTVRCAMMEFVHNYSCALDGGNPATWFCTFHGTPGKSPGNFYTTPQDVNNHPELISIYRTADTDRATANQQYHSQHYSTWTVMGLGGNSSLVATGMKASSPVQPVGWLRQQNADVTERCTVTADKLHATMTVSTTTLSNPHVTYPYNATTNCAGSRVYQTYERELNSMRLLAQTQVPYTTTYFCCFDAPTKNGYCNRTAGPILSPDFRVVCQMSGPQYTCFHYANGFPGGEFTAIGSTPITQSGGLNVQTSFSYSFLSDYTLGFPAGTGGSGNGTLTYGPMGWEPTMNVN